MNEELKQYAISWLSERKLLKTCGEQVIELIETICDQGDEDDIKNVSGLFYLLITNWLEENDIINI